MYNPFKRKYLVPIDDCFEVIRDAMLKDEPKSAWSLSLWDWIEQKHGIKRKWSSRKNKNYLVFDSEQDYTWFLLKL